MNDLTIGRLATDAGVSPETLRYYERVGVLREPRRNELGQRRYAPGILDELRLLRAAQAAGFSLSEIARLLEFTRQDPVPCRDMCGIVEEQIARLDEQIRELSDARTRLADALAACEPHAANCVVVERLVSDA